MTKERGLVTRRRRKRAGGLGGFALIGFAACGERASGPAATQKKDVELSIIQQPTFSTELDNQVYPAGYDIFREKTGIRVSAQTIAEVEIRPKVTAMVAAGSSPDGSYVHPSKITSMAAASLLLPIETYVSKDKSLNLADLYPSVLAYFRAPSGSGKLYGLPFTSNPAVVLFNRGLFERHGVKMPDQLEKEGGWTWDRLREISVQITRGTADDKTWGWESINTAIAQHICALVWSSGGEVWDKDLTKTRLGEAVAMDALQNYADMRARFNTVAEGPEVAAIPSLQRIGRVGTGRVAMQFNSRLAVPNFAVAAEQYGVKPAVAPLPKGKSGRVTRNGPSAYMVVQGTKHPEEVYQLGAWMTTTEFQRIQYKVGGTVPVRKSQMESEEFQRSLKPWEPLAIWKETAEADRALAYSTRNEEIEAIFGEVYNRVKTGMATMKEVMPVVEPQMNALLAEARSSAR
jgi:ABC-type glycerol-3-phosphate transport system substrate-binding protein